MVPQPVHVPTALYNITVVTCQQQQQQTNLMARVPAQVWAKIEHTKETEDPVLLSEVSLLILQCFGTCVFHTFILLNLFTYLILRGNIE